jgi:hypothetical protein
VRRERDVERYFIAQARALGGWTHKLTFVGRRGAPDRLAGIPGYGVAFVELKRPAGGRLSAAQHRRHSELRSACNPVWVLSSREDIDSWAKHVRLHKTCWEKSLS